MRIALCIEYDGASYSGWQRQSHRLCVQECVETAIEKVSEKHHDITCAGRTDAGVHATYQVVHFDTDVVRPLTAWTRGLNSNLPDTVCVRWAKEMNDDFHARFSATARRYRYIIFNDELRPGILKGGVSHVYYPLNAELMNQAAQCLVGEHDFTSFRAANCQSKTPFRTVKKIHVYRQGKYIIMDVEANAFLHHMVRNFIGTLMVVGRELEPVSWVEHVLKLKNRVEAGITAKPNGLYLIDVEYPAHFELPKSDLGPLFLQSYSAS